MEKKTRILIADETEGFGKRCKKELEQLGFEAVLVSKDGEKVISALDGGGFDVLLIDVFMPGADAFDVLEHISQSAVEKPLVLVMSAVDKPSLERQLVDAGADYYFIKPVSSTLVAKRIERLSEYMASTGRIYKNHLATIRSWAKRDEEKARPAKQYDHGNYQFAAGESL